MIKRLGRINKYLIYIGMNDKDKMTQIMSKEELINIIKNVCTTYRITFSSYEVYGGYITSDGTYINENSLVLAIAGFKKKDVFKLAEELRIKFNQESIMVCLDNPVVYNIKG